MAKLEIMNNATRAFNKFGLKMKKHSPEILVGVGIVGTVAATVMACKATTKLETVLAEHKENIEKLHDYVEEKGFSEEYTEKDKNKDLTIMYTKAGVDVAKLYGPAFVVGAMSIGAILTGHNMLHKRYVATAAAYTAIDKSFKEYRDRVVERFGKELDKELKYNIKAKEVEEIVVHEDGSESVVKNTVDVMDPNEVSDYAKIWDDGCTGWTKDPEYNLMFLKNQQRYANDRLKSKGYLFLNEVYEMLGIPRTKAGQVVGWIYDEKHPNGDNFVDFGIYNIHSQAKRNFVNGYERTILLDFNVDGHILDLI